MKRLILIALAALAPTAAAQSQRVDDVGLTLDLGPLLPAFVGYACGSFTCTPIDAGTFGVGTTRTFVGYSSPGAPWVLVAGLPGACTPIPGIGNALLTGAPLVVLHTGVTGPALPTGVCKQGAERVPLTMPRGAPIGLVLRFQNAGISATSGALAFGPALDATIG